MGESCACAKRPRHELAHSSTSRSTAGNQLFKFPQAWTIALKVTHSSTLSLKLLPLHETPTVNSPTLQLPLTNGAKATHPLFNLSIVRRSQQAGKVGDRRESQSPAEKSIQSVPKSTLAFSKPAPRAGTDTVLIPSVFNFPIRCRL